MRKKYFIFILFAFIFVCIFSGYKLMIEEYYDFSCSVKECDILPEDFDSEKYKAYRIIYAPYNALFYSGYTIDEISTFAENVTMGCSLKIEGVRYDSKKYPLECHTYAIQTIDKTILEYTDYSDLLYPNALRLTNNALICKYNDITIEDMYILSGTQKEGKCVYYKTNKGDYIYYCFDSHSSNQYVLPFEEYIKGINELASKKDAEYDKVGIEYGFIPVLSKAFLEQYKVPMIDCPEVS